jgi:hypothetical protein
MHGMSLKGVRRRYAYALNCKLNPETALRRRESNATCVANATVAKEAITRNCTEFGGARSKSRY